MADNVVCDNSGCDERGIAKANPNGYPTAEIICGSCGSPVIETSEEADTGGAE